MKKYLSIKDFNVCIRECKEKSKLQKLKAIFLYRIQKNPAKKVALVVHTSANNIYQWAHKYKKNGAAWFEAKPRGGRKKEVMTLAEEAALLNEILEDSNKGLIVIANRIQKTAEEKAGKKIHKYYAYSLLKRHNWRKIKPRPKNPKSSKEVQDEFKKNFAQSVQDVAKTFDPQDTRPLKLVFEDEGRFGRISMSKKCWAPMGIRPIVPSQLVRQFLYVFTVVCPITGSNFSLILPDTDTAVMNVFLSEVSNYYKDYRVIIVADQASWHKSQGLQKFNNIRFIYLPSGSPELNPAEHIWDHVREKHFTNRIFDSIDELQAQLIEAFKEMHYNPASIQSLVSFHWTKLSFIF
jgi:transposase